MGLVRIVIQEPEGKSYGSLNVALRQTEPAEAGKTPVGQDTTDKEGVVRFWVEPGTYKVQFNELPEGMTPPKYGTTVRLEEFAEGIEQFIRLVKSL